MKPEQFIREFGVDKAREVVEGAPDLSLFYDLEKQKHVLKESTSIAMAFLKNRFIPIEDLKRLVESVELIEELGGINLVKDHGRKGGLYGGRVITAIRDHESIYGGGHV
ncbi:hypothetical protein [Acinetobacter baumannii]|uniref:hypothetical protein n=1 Tax=Acinetobacter baumannii TaxID=470 RepID=UPI002340646A|nr:hypothetical protein [Acinetobacter baumannii]